MVKPARVYGYLRLTGIEPADRDAKVALAALLATDHGPAATTFVDSPSVRGVKRPEWGKCLTSLRKGDSLAVLSFGHLGHDLSEIVAAVEKLFDRSIGLTVFTRGIRAETGSGRALTAVVAALA